MAKPVSWSKIIIEMKKCILLCSNCHREVHENLIPIPKHFQEFDENLLKQDSNSYLTKNLKITYCPVCNKQKSNSNLYCSLSCAATTKNKIDWNSINLIDLIENQKIPKIKIAEMLGCSDQAVHKRYKKLKLQFI